MQSSSWLEVQAKGLDSIQREVLGLLALYGDANISTLTELASASGLRATPTRQLSTTTLRPHIDALVKAGVARHGNAGFGVVRSLKHSALRDAAARGRLDALARVVIANRFSPAHYGGRTELAQKGLLELDVALARGGAEVEAALGRALDGAAALGNVPRLEVAARSVFPALVPFDRAWFERLPEAVQSRLFGISVSFAENIGNGLGDLYEYAFLRPRLFAAEPCTLSALFGVAILAGDLAKAALLASTAQGDVRSTLQAALALATGAFAEEHPFVPPKKDEPVGVARLLQGLLLLGRGRVEDLDGAERIAQAGNRKAAAFKCSSGWLKELIELSQGRRSPFQKRAFESSGDTDCLNGLFRAMFAIWADDASVADLSPVPMERYAAYFNGFGQHWLSAQYRACTKRLERVSRPAAPTSTIFGPLIGSPKPKESKGEPDASSVGMTVRPLFELRTAKEPWELSLEALERVAATADPPKTPILTPVQERILWRVSPSNLDIEPYLQVSKAGAFTRGRKLAIKHLLAGAKQLERLPAEDRAVAQHARERREPSYGYGYPQVFHSLEARAWLDLVGHPRVELQGTEQPVEVVRGRVQVLAEAEGDALILKLEPNDLTRELSVRQEPGKLVVYQVEKQALPLLALLHSSLALPLAARERALATLGRLAHLVPVQTSERTAAQLVPADARLWLRVVPRSGGLSLAAFVRPLGAAGPELVPGVGAAHLLGHLGGEAVQTERDLASERAALSVLLAECPLLEGLGVASDSVVLEDAESCLELLSVLQRPECQVVVLWPEGAPLKLRGRIGRGALRARIQRGATHFFAEGTLTVDDSLSLELQELVALVAESPGKFARLANGDFIELERDLRDTLELLGAASVELAKQQRGVALSRSAFAMLDQLSMAGSGFVLDSDVASYRAQLEAAFSRTPKLPRGLEAELRDYQLDGFRWLARLADAELSACLADDMGLGKTLQAIALLLYRAKQGPALVVAPTSVCDNWRRELTRFAPSLELRMFAGAGREQELEGLRARQVVITSYALLQQSSEQLQRVSFATAILDEAQMIKNAESLRARAACALDAKVRFALTGTPVENHIGDLYSIFRFLLPDLVGSWPAFNRRFGAARSGEAGNLARRSLKRLLRPYLLRRTKAQVLEELPPLTEIEHRVTLGPAEVALYEGVRRNALLALEQGAKNSQARFRVLAEITRLRRLCCHPQLVAPTAPAESAKLDALMELIAELREGRHRALVFSQFVDVLSLVRARLDTQSIPYQYLDGATPPARRTAAVDAFQSGDGDVFLISLKAGGFGLNLTAADYVIHVDPWWNPAVEAQASDRAHRIGQTRPVTVYRLIASGTIEERIVELHQKKRELATSLLDDSHSTAALSPDELRVLLAPVPSGT
jgi:superfamily II DNA or RNA helicase